MRVKFWGTGGSLPTSCNAAEVRAKIKSALAAVRDADLNSERALETFIDTLPFAVRGTCGGNTSCVELRGGDEYVICDAGSGLRDLGAYLMKPEILDRPKPPRVFNIFLSHLHWDHIMGFPFFLPAFIPGNTIRIYSSHDDPEGTFMRQQAPPTFPVPLKAMSADISFHSIEPGKTRDIAGFRVRALKQNHPGDSYGFRFERDGKAAVYSTDAEHKSESHEKDYPYLDFIKDADLLIIDTQYVLADAIGMKEDWGHASNIGAVELAANADVKRLCMFHHEHMADDHRLEKLLKDTRSYLKIFAESSDLKIDMAYDGLEVEV
ncbi:MBL fold metallo-hydrolase [Elusimicrobiota bacterium]